MSATGATQTLGESQRWVKAGGGELRRQVRDLIGFGLPRGGSEPHLNNDTHDSANCCWLAMRHSAKCENYRHDHGRQNADAHSTK